MNASMVLWENWWQQVKQFWADLHGHQQKTLALVVLGIVLSGSAVLQRMAESLQQQGISEAKMPSIERRLARFVANRRIVVKVIWKTFLSQVLAYWKGKTVQVVLDCTPCGEHATIVYVGLLVHSRVLPLSWRVMPQQEHWEQGQWELVGQMLDEVATHLEARDCTLIADRGLSGAPLVQLCRDRQWHYLVRICAEHTSRRWIGGSWRNWQPCGQLIREPGQQWFGRILLWQEGTIQTHLSAVWEPGYKEPWFLISDQPAGRGRVRQYSWRMRVEATFEDSKSRGWNLEASLIEDRERLNRLLLALFIAMWWVIHLAASCIHHGQRDRFDRHDRRDKKPISPRQFVAQGHPAARLEPGRADLVFAFPPHPCRLEVRLALLEPSYGGLLLATGGLPKCVRERGQRPACEREAQQDLNTLFICCEVSIVIFGSPGSFARHAARRTWALKVFGTQPFKKGVDFLLRGGQSVLDF